MAVRVFLFYSYVDFRCLLIFWTNGNPATWKFWSFKEVFAVLSCHEEEPCPFSPTRIFSPVWYNDWSFPSEWLWPLSSERVSTQRSGKNGARQKQIFTLNAQTQTLKTSKKKTNQTPPRQVPVKHDHMSPGEQGHTAQPSSGWQRDVIVEGGIGGIAHPFRSGPANMMRSENAIFKKRKKWLDACSVVIEEGQMG